MDLTFAQQFILATFGLITTGTVGATAYGVRRLVTGVDQLRDSVQAHSVEIAAMKVKLPNGEWRAIKDDVASLSSDVRELKQSMVGVETVMTQCKAVLNAPRRTTRKPRGGTD